MTSSFAATSVKSFRASRYLPDLSAAQATPLSIAQLFEYASKSGRRNTVAAIRHQLRINCERAGLEVYQSFSGCSTLVNLSKVRRLAQAIEQVYETVLTFYERQAHSGLRQDQADSLLEAWTPEMEALSVELQPTLEALRIGHLSDVDPHSAQIVAAQFECTTRLVLKRLSPIEKALIGCYFRLAEDQSCSRR